MECAKCYLITTPFGLNSCQNASCLTNHSCEKRLFPGKNFNFHRNYQQNKDFKSYCLQTIGQLLE